VAQQPQQQPGLLPRPPADRVYGQLLLLVCVLMSCYSVLHRPKKLKEGKAHPDPVVETLSLAAVDPPPVTYQHALQVRWVLLLIT
jgi:hypothetical protein